MSEIDMPKGPTVPEDIKLQFDAFCQAVIASTEPDSKIKVALLVTHFKDDVTKDPRYALVIQTEDANEMTQFIPVGLLFSTSIIQQQLASPSTLFGDETDGRE